MEDNERFPDLANDTFMTHIFYKYLCVIVLDMRKWIRGLDKAGLFNLLWVPHYNRAPITLIVIKELLCLVHEGCFWLGEGTLTTDMLIHRITLLPQTGMNLAKAFAGKVFKRDLVKRIKEKFKFVKKMCNYLISSIANPKDKVATQILAGKIIRKCHGDELLTLVVSLVAHCMDGIQFNRVHSLCSVFVTNY